MLVDFISCIYKLLSGEIQLVKRVNTITCYPLWLQSINIAVISYTRTLRITLKTKKGFIDEKFKFCAVKAFEVISKAAMAIPNKSKC